MGGGGKEREGGTVGEHLVFFLIPFDIEHTEFIFVVKEGILEFHKVGFDVLQHVGWSLEVSQFQSLDVVLLQYSLCDACQFRCFEFLFPVWPASYEDLFRPLIW